MRSKKDKRRATEEKERRIEAHTCGAVVDAMRGSCVACAVRRSCCVACAGGVDD